MARAVDSILDPWPTSKDPIWDFFGSECAYCGVKLVEGERLGHIDHAAPKAGNHMGNLVLACSMCNGDEKLELDWREFLEQKVSDQSLRQERIERIERWQALHPKPDLAASPEVAEAKAELRAMIVAFGEKCAELRAAVADAKSAAAGSEGQGWPRGSFVHRTSALGGPSYPGSEWQDDAIWSWTEKPVDFDGPHFILGDDEHDFPLVRVGPPVGHEFAVEFLIPRVYDAGDVPPVVAELVRQIGFYLVEKREPDPWAHAQHHTGTMANAVSEIHWYYSNGRDPRE